MINLHIDDREHRLLESWTEPGMTLDRWEDLTEPEGSSGRVGLVVLVTTEDQHEPDGLPWSDKWVLGYTTEPNPDPAERFLEALRQERSRAEERLTSGSFETVWPPKESRTLLALAANTRDGMVRVTWLPDGRTVVQGTPPELLSQVPVDLSEPSVIQWAQSYGFAHLYPPE